ncbi:glycosyltransferase family 1 protein [Oceanobacillus sp. CF4.6]|uniref:glycosyltransferase family 1 protein n=1 Tax=Oceanobacillus sp. CF4.6 TaxID=3373080 RepID=UPI003EE503FA
MGNPLRILHVVVNMNRGGAETLIMNLYRNMDRTKVQFDFLTCKEGVFDEEIIAMGGKVQRIRYVTRVGHMGYIRELDYFFKNNPEYQIVHSHMDKMSGFVLRSARRANIPVRIAHSHNTDSEGGFLSKTYKSYAGSYVKANATHLYACSLEAANWLYGEESEKAYVLNNGIETKKFLFSYETRIDVRSNLNLNQDTLVIGHVGRFAHQKNHKFLLEVFADVHKKVPNSCLLLIGEGSLKENMIDKVKGLKLEKSVIFLGVREDIHTLLQAFDVFAFPSLHEGLGISVIEAQCSGLPCIISTTITKEVDMDLGLVNYIPLSDRETWREKIINLAKDFPSRDINHEDLLQKGYDIKNIAKNTQKSYLTLGEEVI